MTCNQAATETDVVTCTQACMHRHVHDTQTQTAMHAMQGNTFYLNVLIEAEGVTDAAGSVATKNVGAY